MILNVVPMLSMDIPVDSSIPNFELIGPPKPVKSALLVARRIKNEAKFYIKDDSGAINPTINVFREDRPTGISMDVFWDPGSTSESKQTAAVIEAKKICQKENFDVIGWTTFTVGNLQKHAKECVNRVIHTPTHTNKHHADLLVQKFMQIQDERDEERKSKALAVAKILREFAINHGAVVISG